jgi:hypothetical protein
MYLIVRQWVDRMSNFISYNLLGHIRVAEYFSKNANFLLDNVLGNFYPASHRDSLPLGCKCRVRTSQRIL